MHRSSYTTAGVGSARRGRSRAAVAHASEPPENGDLSDARRYRLAAADGRAGQTRQDLQPGELQGRDSALSFVGLVVPGVTAARKYRDTCQQHLASVND